jgi:hypothetical protein
LYHTGLQEVTQVAVPEEPEKQPEEQEVPEADEEAVRIFQSAQTTVRALSREASPGAFLSPGLQIFY